MAGISKRIFSFELLIFQLKSFQELLSVFTLVSFSVYFLVESCGVRLVDWLVKCGAAWFNPKDLN